jgi:hypothetical protein
MAWNTENRMAILPSLPASQNSWTSAKTVC